MAAHHSAQGLASLGRHGDSMLVHMSPHEVAGLNYLAKKQGHKLTINPATGLPEAFSLGGFFSSLLPMFAGMAMGPAGMGALLAGAATGAGLAAVKGENPLLGGLMGGMGGWSGGNLAGAFGAGDVAAGAAQSTGPGALATEGAANMGNVGMANTFNTGAGTTLGQAGTYSQALNPTQYTGAQSMMENPVIRNQSGAGAGSSFSGSSSFNPMENLKTSFSGAKDVVTGKPGSWESFKNYFNEPGQPATTNLQAGMKLGMPLGGAVLGGLEPSDIYGEPIDMSEAKKKQAYDPYATLNLSGSTGLKLYAAGGNVNTNAPSISTGGLQDLYGTSDNSGGPQALSQDGYGVGRLEGLTAAGSQAKAADMFYAQGGPISFADGGSSDKVKLEDLSTPTDATTPSPVGIAALANSAQMDQGNKAPSDVNLAAPPTATDGSLITQVANNLKVDPNYQPKNPIEAAIIKQLKGTDPMQQTQQGLGSLGAAPSQPMAPSYNPSVAMGPTYFAGMNAPRGYADGGDVSNYKEDQASLNLDRLPSLNVNTGTQIPAGGIDGLRLKEMNPFGQMVYRFASMGSLKPTIGSDKQTQDFFYSPHIKYGTNPETQNFRKLMETGSYAHGGYLDGAGDGMSDSIPATIEGKQPARLADGEFVVPADVVSHLGNGSSKAGSQRLYSMLDKVRKARTGNKKQSKEINPNKYMPA